mgnify:CR=1 FL=1
MREEERLDNLTRLVALQAIPLLRSQGRRIALMSTLLLVVVSMAIISTTLSAVTLWVVLNGS